MTHAALAFPIVSLAALAACVDPAATPMTASATVVDAEKCARTHARMADVLSKAQPTRAELQSLIEDSADYCPLNDHGFVVQPVCSAHPDACIGKLEEELR